MKLFSISSFLLLMFIVIFSCKDHEANDQNSKKIVIIAHRGAQSILPEHTIEGYKKAIELGADFIEPDLVLTKDGHLIVRHEPMLSGTTNVSEVAEFANLKTTKNVDGKMVTDWFAIDFTLAQIKKLKAKQAYNGRPTNFDNQFNIPTFKEVIELTKNRIQNNEKLTGIYPEIKHPYFHNSFFGSHFMENKLIKALQENNLDDKDSLVYVQCFEVEPLQYLNTKLSVKLVQLISTYSIKKDGSLNFNVSSGDFISYVAPYDFHVKGDQRTYEFFTTEEGMKFTATYADGIGPWKPFIISYKTDEKGTHTLLPPTNFVKLAHKNNLLVHPYTFRNENKQWSNQNPEAEYHLFFDAGIDGLFTDYTDEAVNALKTWKKK